MAITSVIIPTCGRVQKLERLLAYLAEPRGVIPGQLEVIVVEDDSARSSVGMIKEKFPFVGVVYGEGRGVAAAANLGVASSHGEWVTFLDDDALPDENWAHAMVSLPASIAVGCFGVVLKTGSVIGVRDLFPGMPYGDDFFSACMVVRREFWEALGPFKEELGRRDYFGPEQVGWRHRVAKQGLECVALSACKVAYEPRVMCGLKQKIENMVLRYRLTLYMEISPSLSGTLRGLWHHTRSRTAKIEGFIQKWRVWWVFVVESFLLIVLFDRLASRAAKGL